MASETPNIVYETTAEKTAKEIRMNYPEIIDGHIVANCDCEHCVGLKEGKIIFPEAEQARIIKTHDEISFIEWQKACAEVMTPKYEK